MERRNRIKELFRNKKIVTGAHVRTQDPCMSELIATIGYDIVWVENEHSFLDKCNTNLHVLAAQAGGAAAVVRVAWNDPVLVKPVLEMGVDGVIFPLISSAEDARKAVASCLYPPQGVRGFGPIRANRYGLISTEEYLKSANDDLFKILQIEHVDGVRDIDRILEVSGVDAIVVGQNDLSGSMGKLGMIEDPEVQEMMRTVFEACKRHGIPGGISCGPSARDLDMWFELGINFVFMPNEFEWVRIGAVNALDMIKTYERRIEG